MTSGWTTRARWAALAGGALLLATLSGCSAVPDGVQASWRLASLTDARGSATSTGKAITLRLTGDEIASDDSCNSYDGRVLSTDPWKASDLAATAMGCVSGDNPLRARFTTLLAAATTARRDGADLVLDAPGSSELRFVRVAARG
ncbi:hypothetical protein AS850_09860 [Frondihabitans sp. 762G35]|uniref:META domain-containing protein n=1 Tax=Frondihabitans sp. 762G35 TaxID=1446794 RepID=UPI000D2121FD|nr:META domain-containing protein [Frondihabitans sp. 762G35]ARC57380.1 hypothetical protein AS850_09860 [Frondihabitans sp. 762G35]